MRHGKNEGRQQEVRPGREERNRPNREVKSNKTQSRGFVENARAIDLTFMLTLLNIISIDYEM